MAGRCVRGSRHTFEFESDTRKCAERACALQVSGSSDAFLRVLRCVSCDSSHNKQPWAWVGHPPSDSVRAFWLGD